MPANLSRISVGRMQLAQAPPRIPPITGRGTGRAVLGRLGVDLRRVLAPGPVPPCDWVTIDGDVDEDSRARTGPGACGSTLS